MQVSNPMQCSCGGFDIVGSYIFEYHCFGHFTCSLKQNACKHPGYGGSSSVYYGECVWKDICRIQQLCVSFCLFLRSLVNSSCTFSGCIFLRLLPGYIIRFYV